MYISLWENYRGHPDNISFMQFSTKIDGFEQKDSQGFENSYNSYEQYPLEKFLIFTIYQNYTLALIMQIYANLFKINEKCYFSVISWPILILFVLFDRAWCGLQNFYTEFWNSLIMQIYSNQWKMLLLYFLADVDSVCFIW